ncbi:hypothetical protein FS837_008697 [Tulasnella sp. UAMH 9824]|nr:hypothetical protein FS837_008697 [Tulasnella sp. UAMH 9824]
MSLPRIMKTEKISILALQETHETEQALSQLESLNENLWCFSNPGSTHRAGTGFVVDRHSIPGTIMRNDLKHEIITPRRADLLTLTWGEERLRILNIYTPNADNEAFIFFKDLRLMQWNFAGSMGLSDHSVVAVKILESNPPYVGLPRWRMNLEDLEDQKGMDLVEKTLHRVEKELKRGADPMSKWIEAKENIKNILTARQGIRRKERSRTLKSLEHDKKELTNMSDFPKNKGLQSRALALSHRIDEIKKAKIDRAAELSSARYASKGAAKAALSQPFMIERVEEAIRRAAPGKSPGADGIPYEFYKYWVKELKRPHDDDREDPPDIRWILMKVWNLTRTTNPVDQRYALGLMYLMFKKGTDWI